MNDEAHKARIENERAILRRMIEGHQSAIAAMNHQINELSDQREKAQATLETLEHAIERLDEPIVH